MPDQFTVPQFIDVEDKIFGPVTARQFIILMIVFLTEFILFKLMAFVWFLALGLPLLCIGGIVAFVKINGQPFHFFILNLIQTFKKPRLRIWGKEYSNAHLREYMDSKPPPPPDIFKRKEFTQGSRLHEISLVVNTGGVYRPEE